MKSIHLLIAGNLLTLVGIGFGLLHWNFIAMLLFCILGSVLNVMACVWELINFIKYRKHVKQ